MTTDKEAAALLLAPYRTAIDAIDDAIIDLLGHRFRIIDEVAAIKAPRGIAVVQPDRIAEMTERLAKRARERDLDPDLVTRLFQQIIDNACERETALIDGSGVTSGELNGQR